LNSIFALIGGVLLYGQRAFYLKMLSIWLQTAIRMETDAPSTEESNKENPRKESRSAHGLLDQMLRERDTEVFGAFDSWSALGADSVHGGGA
jgi:hypothetical protein